MIAPAQPLPIEVPAELPPIPAEAVEIVAAMLLGIAARELAEEAGGRDDG